MQSLLRDARQEAEAAIRANEKPRIDRYEELARRVSGVIREADAAAEAGVMEARAEADRTVAGLATRRDALVEQLAAMQERLIAVAHDLERTIEIDGPETPAADTDVAVARTDATETDATETDASVAPADSTPASSSAAEVVIDVTGGD